MREHLFRSQVTSEQNNKAFGGVLIQPTWAFRAIIYVLIAIFVSLGLFLFLGNYHRKESVRGLLIPTGGIVKVYAPRQGLITKVKVQEGSEVQVGSPLFELAQSQIGAEGSDISALKRAELRNLHDKLTARLQDLPRRFKDDELALMNDSVIMEKTLKNMKSQIEITRKRLILKELRLRRLTDLAKEKAISQDEVDQEKDNLLLLHNKIKSDEQALLQESERAQALQRKIKNASSDSRIQESQLLQELSQVKHQMLDFELQESQTVQAPIAGKVTSLQIYQGLNVESHKPILTILPLGGTLEAHLFVPTKAIGFLQKDKKVLLQYDAFPFQKYGVFQGVIKEVSRSVLNPSEIHDVDLSQIQEPLYRVVVTLRQQSIPAFGQEIPLQSGMLLKADIILENRSLIQWLLEPLYRAKG